MRIARPGSRRRRAATRRQPPRRAGRRAPWQTPIRASSHSRHRGPSEKPLGPEVENTEDDEEPAHEPHLATEEVDVRAEEVQRHTEHETSNNRADGAVEPTQHGS